MKPNKNIILKNWPIFIVIIILSVSPFRMNNYWIDVFFFFGIYALLGLSLNIVLGEVGLFDLGHMGFMAIGAYTTAILNTHFGIPIIFLMPVSALAAAGFAWLVCSPIIHLRGDYLCIVTIGMGEIVRLTLINNPFGITGGPNGVFGIDFLSFGGPLVIDSSIESYFVIWIVVGLTILALINLQRSRIGRAWNCIREDEIAAESTGIDVRYYKLLAFVLGAGLAGIAGNIYASKLMIVSPESFSFIESCMLFCIVLIGGMGSIPGIIIGSAAVSLFPEIFRAFARYRMLIFGAAMVIMMVFRPGGIWPRKRGSVEFKSLLTKAGEDNV
ncbi:MAG: branched-chain amino acid ABC transporter permease [Candidatus Infernicultor aquiphilus]|uniref:Branched-chain amino acid ABC transporter permease n=2 Tax=Candidatus Infernicultor aquiphilus TaxID=1805029 RepID=A0A1J5GNI7_9BACT|nr:branched-chain amino acid ABC transporter permease [bacterium]OIP70199.1 MAG: branched-chain amino acid ABC transporter permease [Candidatus Atribacteria bacterium CG2_30_33_13]PIU24667.1 MAG: branched-chain amino acid ABC transporter permease [Candidatus Atribacteria bacterium CG08_land_8_20_14_0_20_33_29]PIW12377.1 MAG: branched-chain amino acid ABC transporter permease [Candidatus Atribacteria bacterium CG17_big_fil_post_rev_8_21_14_2_50_34_11]PIX35314.1 MAG: branched-chain amino acid ABC